MATIAFVGSDGSGKTTIIDLVQKKISIPTKSIYMGLNLESSNYVLPTSKLLLKIKLLLIKKKASKLSIDDPVYLTTHHYSHRQQKRSKITKILRTFNRLFEAWFRQIVSWYFQIKGKLVIYDRHMLFDSAPNPRFIEEQLLSNKIYRWILTYFLPKVDLVIFLDADPEVLLQRKQEVPLEYLENQRVSFMEQGRKTKNFIIVDASQPVEKVYSDVESIISNFLSLNRTI